MASKVAEQTRHVLNVLVGLAGAALAVALVVLLRPPEVEAVPTMPAGLQDSVVVSGLSGPKATMDRGPKMASVTPTALGSDTFSTPASAVQGWLSAPSSNNGIVLADTTNFDGFVMSTKEGTSPPRLAVNYAAGGGG